MSSTPTLTTPSGPAQHRSRRRGLLLTLAPLLLVLAGVIVLLYPVVATQHNNAEQARVAAQYSASVTSMSPDARETMLAEAKTYNENLAAMPILDPWLDEQRPGSPQYQAYLGELDFEEVIARVSIPKIHVNLPVYHGTEELTLARGVGHLFGTSLPVGGASTHSVLTGHTGLGSATLFDQLVDLELGDVFYISVLGETLKYEVVSIETVEPSQTESLRKVAGRDLVTLITCTPYGVNSHRLLVTGERVPVDPVAASIEEAEAMPAPMQAWMVVVLAAVVLILVVAAAAVVHWVVAGRRQADRTEADRTEAEPTP